jgi:ribosomal protein L4
MGTQMEIQVKDIQGKAVKKVALSSDIFGVEMNEHVLHLVVKAYQANRRQGTHATKTKAMVSGGGTVVATNINSTKTSARVSGGTTGTPIKLRYRVTLSDGRQLDQTATIPVAEA